MECVALTPVSARLVRQRIQLAADRDDEWDGHRFGGFDVWRREIRGATMRGGGVDHLLDEPFDVSSCRPAAPQYPGRPAV